MNSEHYIAAAYLAAFVAVLVYVLIIALKLARLEATVSELVELAEKREHPERPTEREATPVG